MWHDTRLTKRKKSVALLYTSDKRVVKEIRETSSFTIAKNNIKYLGLTLIKQVKNFYDNSFKCLKKVIEEVPKMERTPMFLDR